MPIMYLTATIYKQLFSDKVEIHVAKKPVPIYESEERGSSDISETVHESGPIFRGAHLTPPGNPPPYGRGAY